MALLRCVNIAKIKTVAETATVFIFGGRYGDRTHDLSVANAALSRFMQIAGPQNPYSSAWDVCFRVISRMEVVDKEEQVRH